MPRSTRTSSLGSRLKLQLRFEVFNVFNTVNFLGYSLNTGYNAENVVFDTGDASHGDEDPQRHAPGQLRATHRGPRPEDDTAGNPPDVLSAGW